MTLPGQWVGREEQLSRVREALAAGSPHRGIGIVGPPGVGKTRLGRETLARLHDAGWATHLFTATASSRRIPFGAVASVVADSDSGDQLLLIRGVVNALLDGTDGSRTVIMFDDVQHLDAGSALIVHQIATTTSARVVLTMRAGDTVPDAVLSLFKERLIDRVELPPLSEAETLEAMGGILGGPIEPGAASRMWALTKGNALYLLRIIEDERRYGRLTVIGGSWNWRGPHRASSDLIELVGTQMGAIAPDIGRLMDLLAVAEPLPFEQVRHHLGSSPIELAEDGGLITASPHGHPEELRLAHPLFGEVRRAAIGVVRAARLRGLAATMLADAPAPTQHGMMDLRRALLTLDSDLPPDPGLFLRGAREASRLVQLNIAERLATAAAAAGAGTNAVVAGAYAVTLMGRGDDARHLLDAAEVGNAEEGERVEMAIIRAGNLFFDLGDATGAADVLIETAASVPASRAAALVGSWTNIHAFQGRPMDALRAATTDIDHDAPAIASLMLHWGLMVAHADNGDLSAARDSFHRALTAADADPNVSMLRIPIAFTYARALLGVGEVIEAEAAARDAIDWIRDLPDQGATAMTSTIRGLLELAHGDLADAVRDLSLAADVFREAHDTAGWDFVTRLHLVTAYSQSGDASRAEACLHAAMDNRHTAMLRYEPEARLAAAWAAAAGGADSLARAHALTAADIARARSQYAVEALALHTAVRFDERGCASRLATLAQDVDGPRVRLAARQAQALERRDAASLSAVAVEFEAIGDRLSAADAAAQGSVAHRQAGLVGSALSSSAVALRLASACGGATSPALRGITSPPSLSNREREIARLVARGMSNRAIAELLVISVRTVEGHVYRASTKLGVESRTDLARLSGGP